VWARSCIFLRISCKHQDVDKSIQRGKTKMFPFIVVVIINIFVFIYYTLIGIIDKRTRAFRFATIARKPLYRSNGRCARDGIWNAATGVRRRRLLWQDMPKQPTRVPQFRQWVGRVKALYLSARGRRIFPFRYYCCLVQVRFVLSSGWYDVLVRPTRDGRRRKKWPPILHT